MKRPFLSLVLLLCSSAFTLAQGLDKNFHSPVPLRAADIQVIREYSNGKLLIGGDLVFIGDEPVGNLARLNSDGTFDNTFSFDASERLMIEDAIITSTNEVIVIANGYDTYKSDWTSGGKLFRLQADGTIINEIEIANRRGIALQSDGKILLGGQALTRLNVDLTEDNTFSVTLNGSVADIVATETAIYVSGDFSEVNGQIKNDIVKLHLDGTIDNSFDTGEGTTDDVGAITLQSDGKLLLGKAFINEFDGGSYHGMLRLNSDGTVDNTFNSPWINGAVSRVIETNEGIYAAAFIDIDGDTQDRLFRLQEDGSMDPTFTPVVLDDFGSIWLSYARLTNGDVVLNHTSFVNNEFNLSKINSSGVFSETFKPETTRYGTITMGDFQNGKILIAGDFIRLDGLATYGIARLSPNGEVDNSFSKKTNAGEVHQLKMMDDDQILLTTYSTFVKLDQNGDEVSDFNFTPFKYLYQVVKFIVLPNGKIMAGGPNQIYRLNSDGSEDTGFDTGELCCVRSTAFDFDMQGDRVIYGSAFSSLAGVNVEKIARVNTDGSVDANFNTGSGPDNTIGLVSVLENDEILVGGYFDSFDGNTINNRLVKLSADGIIDEDFLTNINAAPKSPGKLIRPKVVQIGSKIYLQDFSSVYVIRTDGTYVEDFVFPLEINSVSDLVKALPSEGGRVAEDLPGLLAMGSFKSTVSNTPVFLVKLNFNGDTNPGEEPNPGSVTAIGKETSNGIKVFPNPVLNDLSVVAGTSGRFTARIMDMSGKERSKQQYVANENSQPAQIDTRNLTAGIYILQISAEDGAIHYRKFSKAE